MKIILLPILSFLVFIFSSFSEPTVEKEVYLQAKLTGVFYYSKCNCGDEHPILVRVKYKVSGQDFTDLKLQNTYTGGIVSTVSVTDLAKDGSVVYQFCIQENGHQEFVSVFVNSKGEYSREIPITINAVKQNIINGTAPEILKN